MKKCTAQILCKAFFLFVVLGCNTGTKQHQVIGAERVTAPLISASAITDSATYYFEGELQDKTKNRTIAVQGELTFIGSKLEGKYHFKTGSGILELTGSVASDGAVTINEKTSPGEFGYDQKH